MANRYNDYRRIHRVIICTTPAYKYKGWLFEYKPNIGAWPLKKDGEPRKRAGMVFWETFQEFYELSDEVKKQHRISGGCLHG